MHTKEQIQFIAENLLSGFIPKDPSEKELVFHFTLPPKSNYKVRFSKDSKGNWLFEGYEEDGGL